MKIPDSVKKAFNVESEVTINFDKPVSLEIEYENGHEPAFGIDIGKDNANSITILEVKGAPTSTEIEYTGESGNLYSVTSANKHIKQINVKTPESKGKEDNTPIDKHSTDYLMLKTFAEYNGIDWVLKALSQIIEDKKQESK